MNFPIKISIMLFTIILMTTLPSILCYSQNHYHYEHYHSDDGESLEPPAFKYSKEANLQHSIKPPRDVVYMWMSALAATALISGVPFIILAFIPLDNSIEHQPLLKVLLSFASGGLLGDAFLHLIPHALLSHENLIYVREGAHHHHTSHDSDGHHDLTIGLWVLAGILSFLLIEKFIRIAKGSGHTHFHLKPAEGDDEPEKEPKLEQEAEKNDKIEKEKAEEKEIDSKMSEVKTEESLDESNNRKRVRFAEESSTERDVSLETFDNTEDIKVSGYLNLAADFAHNLTDGLAIGASFIAGRNIGILTTLTMLFHEIPHEIGDFAILIQSGCSKKKAMLLQLGTAFGAFSGTFISLAMDGISDSAALWILPFTAGGFIYIATVSVIPELLEGTSLMQSFKEIAALLVGIGFMVLIARHE